MTIRVATYYDQPKNGEMPRLSHIRAYTRWYSATWDGCVEYDVEADTGNQAKLIARRLRLDAECRARV